MRKAPARGRSCYACQDTGQNAIPSAGTLDEAASAVLKGVVRHLGAQQPRAPVAGWAAAHRAAQQARSSQLTRGSHSHKVAQREVCGTQQSWAGSGARCGYGHTVEMVPLSARGAAATSAQQPWRTSSTAALSTASCNRQARHLPVAPAAQHLSTRTRQHAVQGLCAAGRWMAYEQQRSSASSATTRDHEARWGLCGRTQQRCMLPVSGACSQAPHGRPAAPPPSGSVG
jgi:hypothetical protein